MCIFKCNQDSAKALLGIGKHRPTRADGLPTFSLKSGAPCWKSLPLSTGLRLV